MADKIIVQTRSAAAMLLEVVTTETLTVTRVYLCDRVAGLIHDRPIFARSYQ
jgi:hypothetical protein